MRRWAAPVFGTQVLVLALALGCRSTAGPQTSEKQSSSDDAANDDGGMDGKAADSASGSSSGAKGATERTACGLPAFGATGQPAPSGTLGGLRVLDWAGSRFAVSITFDDSNSSQLSTFADLLALRVPMTFYLQTGKEESNDPAWAQALAEGHELANHTESHLMKGSGPDIDAATKFITEKFGVAPLTMAAPYGDKSYIPLAEERFFINRGTPSGSIAPLSATNPFELPCYVPPTRASSSAMNAVMDVARSQGVWQIELIHGFTGGTDKAFQPVDLAEFLAHVEYTKSLQGVWIDTVVAVGAYFLGQKAVSAATSTKQGETTTWTWSLPRHFPTDRCVRVVVDGGKLSQGGDPLPWNDHGYYEVALDAGTLTLSP